MGENKSVGVLLGLSLGVVSAGISAEVGGTYGMVHKRHSSFESLKREMLKHPEKLKVYEVNRGILIEVDERLLCQMLEIPRVEWDTRLQVAELSREVQLRNIVDKLKDKQEVLVGLYASSSVLERMENGEKVQLYQGTWVDFISQLSTRGVDIGIEVGEEEVKVNNWSMNEIQKYLTVGDMQKFAKLRIFEV